MTTLTVTIQLDLEEGLGTDLVAIGKLCRNVEDGDSQFITTAADALNEIGYQLAAGGKVSLETLLPSDSAIELVSWKVEAS